MLSYKIIGADEKEYGPISAETMQEWVRQGRVDRETRVCSAEGGEWKRLAEMPDLAKTVLGDDGAVCRRCGETIDEGFDSCWKCGTGKDGTVAKAFGSIEAFPKQTEMPGNRETCDGRCPACGSGEIRRGSFRPTGDGSSVVFRPQGQRFFTFSLWGGVMLEEEGVHAC